MTPQCRCGHSDELHAGTRGACCWWDRRDATGPCCGCERFRPPPRRPSVVRLVLARLLGVRR